MPNLWMVRAGSGGQYAKQFLERKCVAIGFGASIDVLKMGTRDQIRDKLHAQSPEASAAKIGSWAGSLIRFRDEIQLGDLVTFYDPSERTYQVGEVTGNCEFKPGLFEDLPQTRAVAWKRKIARDDLSSSSRNALGSLLTIFEPGQDVLSEFQRLMRGGGPAPSPSTAEGVSQPLESLREESEDKAHEFIKDRIASLDWEEMQELVAAILRGMGYRTRVSPRGSDRGKDIVASPDGLGLSSPRIKVEVKHRVRQPMGAPEIRSFIGGLRGDDRGLFVSTGGFSTEATYEAERASVPVTLITLDDVAKLLVQHYEKMDTDGQAIVPLRRVYWPTRE